MRQIYVQTIKKIEKSLKKVQNGGIENVAGSV
jgi:hypothetical protein